MLRMRKRYAISEDNGHVGARYQRSESDVNVKGSTISSMPRSDTVQTSVIMKATEHSDVKTPNCKKKKKLRIKSDDNCHGSSAETNTGILMAEEKTVTGNSLDVLPTKKLQHSKSKKKLPSADAEDSRRKNRKRKFDSVANKLDANVLCQKSEPDSINERTAHGRDFLAEPAKSLACELKHLEDSVVDDYAFIRNELSNMPIADLLQLKERLGAKIYDEVMFGCNKSRKVSNKKFARENKNRPMEMSSKRPVAVVQQDTQSRKHASVARDPRFDDLSGEYNESYFKQSYGFLSDVKLREKQKLVKMLRKTNDANKSAQLQQLITRMTQQEKAERDREEKRQRERAWKKKERERVSQGKRPFHLKKSEKRKLELAEKFRKLEESGKLKQFIAKKKKKNLKTEQNSIPHT